MSVADQHVQGVRSDRTWGCLCGWKQDKPHREHVADMEAAAGESDEAVCKRAHDGLRAAALILGGPGGDRARTMSREFCGELDKRAVAAARALLGVKA